MGTSCRALQSEHHPVAPPSSTAHPHWHQHKSHQSQNTFCPEPQPLYSALETLHQGSTLFGQNPHGPHWCTWRCLRWVHGARRHLGTRLEGQSQPGHRTPLHLSGHRTCNRKQSWEFSHVTLRSRLWLTKMGTQCLKMCPNTLSTRNCPPWIPHLYSSNICSLTSASAQYSKTLKIHSGEVNLREHLILIPDDDKSLIVPVQGSCSHNSLHFTGCNPRVQPHGHSGAPCAVGRFHQAHSSL